MDTSPGIGWVHFIANSDFLSRTILVAMAFASITSWYLIIAKTIAASRTRQRTAAFLRIFWNAPSLDAVARYLEEHPPSEPFSHLTYQGITASLHHERHGASRLSEAGGSGDLVTRTLRKTIDEETARLESGLTVLASIGSTAPFVGLLGTVWGIYHALTAIGLSGTGTLDKVAGPVGEALIMTGIGLGVAIPAVLGYNFLVRSNRVILAQLDAFAHDLYTFFVTGAKIGSQPKGNMPPLHVAVTTGNS